MNDIYEEDIGSKKWLAECRLIIESEGITPRYFFLVDNNKAKLICMALWDINLFSTDYVVVKIGYTNQ